MSTCCGLRGASSRGAMSIALIAAGLLSARTALAEDKEPLAIIELGAAAEWSFNSGGVSFGLVAAVEFTPIKNWLEIEAGVATLFSRGQTEWDTDVVFKKPFELSPTIEFEPGLGPVWMRTISGGRTTDSIGVEVVFDFMFWPTPDRKLGWFLEPSYGYSFGSGHDRSLGVGVGLLVPIP